MVSCTSSKSDLSSSFTETKLFSLQWRHNGRDGVSNHQHHNCLLNRLFRRISNKTSKLCVTGLGAGNSPVTGEFPAQMASNTENVSIGWRHHVDTATSCHLDTTSPGAASDANLSNSFAVSDKIFIKMAVISVLRLIAELCVNRVILRFVMTGLVAF